MTVPWAYPVLMTAAIAAGAGLGRRSQAGLGLDGRRRLGLALGAFCGGILGAKLPFALAHPSGPLSLAPWLSDGKTILAGLVGGYFGVELAKALLGVRVKTGDSFAMPVAVSIGLGRLACFTAGCCRGRPTGLPWGVDFGDGLSRHPTQLYEAAFHLGMAALLAALKRRGRFPRQLMKLYILAYLGYRFASEFLRPEPLLAAGLTAYQWAALALAPVFAGLWLRDRQPAPGENLAE